MYRPGPLSVELVQARSDRRLGPEWRAEGRIDPYDRLWCITAGSGVLELPDRVVTLRPGMLVLVPCGQRFGFGRSRALGMDWAHCRFETASGIALTELVAWDQVLEPSASAPWRTRLHELIAASGPGPGDALRRHAAACALIAPFLRSGSAGAGATARFRPVLEHLHEHLDQPLRVAGLAALAGLAPSSFAAAFRAAFGSSPMRYVTRRRVLQAQRLLLDPELGTAEIAQRCGFADAAHLAHRFREHCGMSPSAYRAELQVADYPSR